jgi:hypothetical protein
MITAKIDAENAKRNWKLYLKKTSKTVIQAINFKCYDGAREALKETPIANKSTILSSLNSASSKYPERTVAEMLVVRSMWAKGQKTFDLQAEVEKLKGQRTTHRGLAKSGWLPAIKKFLSLVNKSFTTISGISRIGYGGGEEARRVGGTVQGSYFNDVDGTGNRAYVESIKEVAADGSQTKVNNDIAEYLSEKLDEPIERFNQS